MRFVDEFRSPRHLERLGGLLQRFAPREPAVLMEVCGTHTRAFHRFGLNRYLPKTVRLVSGPGCPICVSDQRYIDTAIAYARSPGVQVATFADMLLVPGSFGSLAAARAAGARIRTVYSPLEALSLARENPRQKIVFLGVGFETTAPAVALAVLQASRQKVGNLFFLNALKRIPPVLSFLARGKGVDISGILCPGHVSVIIGTRAYEPFARTYGIGCCVAGFEPADMLCGILTLLRQLRRGIARVENGYSRVVRPQGNVHAQRILDRVFEPKAAVWRGFGSIAESGFSFRAQFAHFDARHAVALRRQRQPVSPREGCRCAAVLRGKLDPPRCPLFARRCRPQSPLGPCMVSREGSCAISYEYRVT